MWLILWLFKFLKNFNYYPELPPLHLDGIFGNHHLRIILIWMSQFALIKE